ncbi:MAG TPA: P1 family peptidase [Ktedonobacterales bacterium]
MGAMRLRDLGVAIDGLPAGALNAITDVPGVRVGQVTIIAGSGPLLPGDGPMRTGVTAIVPHGGNLFEDKVAAAVHTINGFGKVAGFEQVRELGTIEAPILLTNTMNVGLVFDAVGTYMVRDNPALGVSTGALNRVVGETNDGFLNDLQGRHVREAHVWEAIQKAAGGPVAEGNVGAGTGTVCFGFKGGIGTASRVLFDGAITVGALAQTNFGTRTNLMVLGAPIGRHFRDRLLPGVAPVEQTTAGFPTAGPTAVGPTAATAQRGERVVSRPESARSTGTRQRTDTARGSGGGVPAPSPLIAPDPEPVPDLEPAPWLVEPPPAPGSIMIVLATDAPASSHLLERMAKRAAFGLARTGAIAEDGSGDFVIAFSTTNRRPHYHRPPDRHVVDVARLAEDPWTVAGMFTAVVEAVEEAILNALMAAETLTGRDDHIAYALPHDELRELLMRYGRR